MTVSHDIIIIGAGSAGGVMGVLLSELGFDVALIDARDPQLPFQPDSRAFAIVRGGWHVLEAAGIAEALLPTAEPLLGIEATDENGVLPAASSMFGVDDLPEIRPNEPLGYMVEVDHLNRAIADRLQHSKAKLIAPETIDDLAIHSDRAEVKLKNGDRRTAQLVIGADGVNSKVRALANIKTLDWSYHQAVVAATIQLKTPHFGKARQWFQDEGPFAILPLSENRGNLAWFREEKAGFATANLSKAALSDEINARFSHLAGEMTVLRDPLAYPLRLRLATSLVSDRIALIGDAVRRVNPLAGQGFNLGLKDVAALAEILSETRSVGLSLADGAQLEAYQRWRRFDSVSTAFAMDGINRVFSNDNKLLHPFRRLALTLGDRIGPIREALARQASADQNGLPALVRGEPLEHILN